MDSVRNELINLIMELPEGVLSSAKAYLESLLQEKETRARRKAIIEDLQRICAGIPGGSEEFMREKHEENEREEQKFEERLKWSMQ